MQIIPLGGAAEVGASCSLLDIAGARILIDAGIRVGSGSRGNAMPDLDALPEPPDALVVTHAHTDHTGALPLVAERIGDALIHMTTASLHLLEVLQGDAVRNMNSDDFDAESGRVTYTIEQVEQAVARIVGHGFHAPFHPVPGREDITFEYIPSGHILGAGMLVITSPEGKMLWTGDYSSDPLPTVGGVDLDWIRDSAKEQPFDFVITEGTYGTSVHPPREKETGRFVELLERITGRGGKILIPAFAVGRAQDITKVIRDAKLAGKLADVPLYLDGMVRPITSIYENLVHQTYPKLPEPLVLLDAERGIYKANGQSRGRLLSGELQGPAIVVSSSGMLVGGRSVQYARAFVGDEKNAILISGYQDAESPGRALLNLKRGKRLRLPDGERLEVRCEIGRYHTSAHADRNEIEAVIKAAGPRKIALVHGEQGALYKLRRKLGGKKRAVVLRNGQPFRMRLRRKWTRGRLKPSRDAVEGASSRCFAEGPVPTEAEVRALWQHLSEQPPRAYAETEIARLFLGVRYSPADRERLSDALADHRLYFITGSRIGQRSYRPRPQGEVVSMMLERANAYQAPLETGDLVLFSDGSPDLFLAAVQQVRGSEVGALVPFSPRHGFRRDWLRAKVGLNIADMLRTKSEGYLLRYLEDVMREARALPDPNVTDAYYHADGGGGMMQVEDMLPVLYPNREGIYSSAMHVAAALALAGAGDLFHISSCGRLQNREVADVCSRCETFAKLHHVRTRENGEGVRLTDGQVVVPNGVFYTDSFEASTADGGTARVSYRRVAEEESAQPLLGEAA